MSRVTENISSIQISMLEIDGLCFCFGKENETLTCLMIRIHKLDQTSFINSFYKRGDVSCLVYWIDWVSWVIGYTKSLWKCSNFGQNLPWSRGPGYGPRCCSDPFALVAEVHDIFVDCGRAFQDYWSREKSSRN